MNLALPGSLSVLLLGLAGVLAWQALAPVEPIEVPPALAREASESAPVQTSFIPPSRDEFAIVNARPLFSPTRASIGEPSETGMMHAGPPDIMLLGVMIGPARSIALLKRPQDAVATTAFVGQTIDGWRLVRIEPGRIVLHGNMADYPIPLRSASEGAARMVSPQYRPDLAGKRIGPPPGNGL